MRLAIQYTSIGLLDVENIDPPKYDIYQRDLSLKKSP